MAPTNAELLQRNESYARNHQPMPTLEEVFAMGGAMAKTAIITCVDPRVLPEKILSLNVGECYIFRTVAGHPQPAMRDLAALDTHTDGGVEDVMIIYHTDCGSLRFDVDKIRAGWIERDPSQGGRLENETFGAVDKTKVETHIKDDVKWLQEQPLLRKGKGLNIKGYLYDIKTGKLRVIE